MSKRLVTVLSLGLVVSFPVLAAEKSPAAVDGIKIAEAVACSMLGRASV